jgi:hypothetical protein
MGTHASNASFHSLPSGHDVGAFGLGLFAAELEGRGAGGTDALGFGGGGGGGGGGFALGGGGGGTGVPPTTLGSSTHVRFA